jgi:uncharacterized protein (DUF305 family)
MLLWLSMDRRSVGIEDTTMNCRTYAIGLTLSFGLALVSACAPAAADEAAMAPSVDCSKASSMMMAPESSASMTSSGDVDKDFARMMMAHSKAAMALAHIEMACGKDAKTRKFAAQTLEQQRQELEDARLLVGAPG